MDPPPPPRTSRPPFVVQRPIGTDDVDDWPVDRGRPLGLRLLALVGALSFLMLGLSVVVPLLAPRPSLPQPPRGLPQATA